MTRFAWGVVLAVMSVGVLGLDIATGPLILFPIAFVIPVGLAAWYLGRGAGLGFALFVVVGRLAIAVTVDAVGAPFWAAIVNAIIRLTVLIVVLELIVRAKHQRKLGERVDILESFLPICAFCKKIRDNEGAWQALDVYMAKKSSTQFSHGFCEACAREHYGEFFPDGDDTLGEREKNREQRS